MGFIHNNKPIKIWNNTEKGFYKDLENYLDLAICILSQREENMISNTQYMFVDTISSEQYLFFFTFITNRDSLDWKNYGVQNIVDTVVEHKALDNGAIILMHNGAKYTASALQSVIDGLKAKGYTFVSIADLIMKESYTIDHTGKQISKQFVNE